MFEVVGLVWQLKSAMLCNKPKAPVFKCAYTCSLFFLSKQQSVEMCPCTGSKVETLKFSTQSAPKFTPTVGHCTVIISWAKNQDLNKRFIYLHFQVPLSGIIPTRVSKPELKNWDGMTGAVKLTWPAPPLARHKDHSKRLKIVKEYDFRPTNFFVNCWIVLTSLNCQWFSLSSFWTFSIADKRSKSFFWSHTRHLQSSLAVYNALQSTKLVWST